MRPLAALPLCWLLLAGGCGSAPPSHFYTLSATGASAAASASGVSVAVGPVTIPAEVDRPQIVISAGPNQVRLDEFNRWAAPLQDNIARVVAENLVALLGAPHVTLYPQTLSADAQYRAAIEVQSFASAPGQYVAVDAVWTVRRMRDGETRNGRTTVREPVQEKGYDPLVATHSRAILRLSEDIAQAVRDLNRSAQ